MRTILRAALLALPLVGATLATAQGSHPRDIVDTAVDAGSFQTLATALTEAHLVEALKGDGPFTVFAPTDAAFAKLPHGTVESLLEPKNRELLTSILTYHVVPGRVPAELVVTLRRAETLSGQRVAITTDDSGVRVDGAKVVQTDIKCTNGIIHVIDSVLMPSSDSIVATAASAGSFATLLKAATAAGLADTLAGDGPFTVFAPTDAAFAKLPKGTLEFLLEPSNAEQLAAILKFHVVSGRVFSDEALGAGTAASLEGKPLSFAIADGRFRVNGVGVSSNDLQASNGVIHVVDQVLLPPEDPKPEPRGRKVIGVYTERPSKALAAQLGIDRNTAMLVTGLVNRGNAKKEGVQEYDVITSIDGMPATDANLGKAKEARGFGGQIQLEIIRGGHPVKLGVTVGVERH